MQLKIDILDIDYKVLENFVPDPSAWAKEKLQADINSFANKIINQTQAAALADPKIDSIPADRDKLLEMAFSAKGYISAVDRAASEKKLAAEEANKQAKIAADDAKEKTKAAKVAKEIADNTADGVKNLDKSEKS